MAKKAVAKSRLNWFKDHKTLTVLVVLVIGLGAWISGYWIHNKYLDYQNKKIVFTLIDDMKSLHTELEQKLEQNIEKSSECTQPQGKLTLPTDSLQCTIRIRSTVADISTFTSEVRSLEKLSSEDQKVYLYSNKYRCSMTEPEEGRIIFECLFSARHPNKKSITEKLESF